MSRRVRLPGADELFRPTGPAEESGETREAERSEEAAQPSSPGKRATGGSGRVKHDEKMTVYVTAEELLDIEHARLSLRRALGQGVDRGRLVREAIALALADLDERGDDSELARRLRKQ